MQKWFQCDSNVISSWYQKYSKMIKNSQKIFQIDPKIFKWFQIDLKIEIAIWNWFQSVFFQMIPKSLSDNQEIQKKFQVDIQFILNFF